MGYEGRRDLQIAVSIAIAVIALAVIALIVWGCFGLGITLIAFARRQVYGLMLGLTTIHFIFLGPPAGNGGPRADQAGNRLR